MWDFVEAMAEENPNAQAETEEQTKDAMVCPVCGAVVVQEKCKLICHSAICRGRIVMNCSEF
jgi:rubredoxin